MATIRITEMDELIATVPALIGFHPRGLVMIGVGRTDGLVTRVDLPSDAEDAGRFAAQVASSIAPVLGVDAVILLVIDPQPRWGMTALVTSALAAHGVQVREVAWADATTAGAAWCCADGCHHGVLPDPTLTEAATTAAVLHGQVIMPDRDSVVAMVQPAPADVLARRTQQLLRPLEDPTPELTVMRAVNDAQAGRLVLDDTRVVLLARALADKTIRDGAIRYCLDEHATAAEHLWLALTRETPTPHVAEPAALLAITALLRGNGPLAHTALDRAQQAAPDHRLTQLLRLATSCPPSELRAMLTHAL